MFEAYLSEYHLQAKLKGPQEFCALPRRQERAVWESVDPQIREYYLEKARKVLKAPIPMLTASGYMEYAQNGNRTHFENLYHLRRENLLALAAAECLENKGQFLSAILDYTWAICEEASWVVPGHNNQMYLGRIVDCLPKAVTFDLVDLFGAETASLLGWICYFFGDYFDSTSPYIMEKIRYEVQRRIFAPLLEGSEMPWMGYQGHVINNWVPWITSNCMAAAAVLTSGYERVRLFQKFLSLLDRFLEQYQPDGGCDEGPGYWNAAGAALFDALELLYAVSGGAIDCYNEPLIRKIGEYIMHAHLFSDRFVNFADGSPKLTVSAELIHRFGVRVGSTPLASFGVQRFNPDEQMRKDKWFVYRTFQNLLHFSQMKEEKATLLQERQTWLKYLQICVSRDPLSGFTVACKGGNNDESHNHNDVGCVIVYKNGAPVFIDPGVETYTAKTFSDQRYTIWTMRSDFHNLPAFHGTVQGFGSQFAARNADCAFSHTGFSFSADLTQAYPAAAGLKSFTRSIQMEYGEGSPLVLEDSILLDSPSEDIQLYFTLAEKPDCRENGVQIADAFLEYDTQLLKASVEEIPLTDEKIQEDWDGRETLYRLCLAPTRAVSCEVLRFILH